MNKVLQVFGVATLTAVVAVSMVACGGDKPKTEAAAPAPVVEEVAQPEAEEATDEATAENESEQPAETTEE